MSNPSPFGPRLVIPLFLFGTAALLFWYFGGEEDATTRPAMTAAAPVEHATISPESLTRKKRPVLEEVLPPEPSIKERHARLRERITKAQKQREETQKKEVASKDTERPTLKPVLDKNYIRAQIREILPLFRECYENALLTDPNLGGKITLKMVLIADEELGGILESSEILADKSDIQNPLFEECMQETAYAAEFNAPENGGIVTIHYPIEFRPVGTGDDDDGAPEDGGEAPEAGAGDN